MSERNNRIRYCHNDTPSHRKKCDRPMCPCKSKCRCWANGECGD